MVYDRFNPVDGIHYWHVFEVLCPCTKIRKRYENQIRCLLVHTGFLLRPRSPCLGHSRLHSPFPTRRSNMLHSPTEILAFTDPARPAHLLWPIHLYLHDHHVVPIRTFMLLLLLYCPIFALFAKLKPSTETQRARC